MRVGDGVGAIVSTVVARMGGGMVSLGYTSRRMQLIVNSDALLSQGVLGALDKAQDRRLRPRVIRFTIVRQFTGQVSCGVFRHHSGRAHHICVNTSIDSTKQSN